MGEYRRPHYNLMLSRLSERRKCIFVLAGPRQVGKSTVMAQIAETIDKVVFQFNADSVNEEDSDWIRRSWESVRSRMDIQHLQEAVLVIDEIQKIRRWSEYVKKEWDTDTLNHVNLKVVLLGSSRLLLRKGLTESLAGRFELIRMGHWTFPEMKAAFGLSLQQWIYFGGYPGSVDYIGDFRRWKKYVKDSLVAPAIEKDVLLTSNIYKPSLMSQLFEVGCSYSGELLSLTKMLGQLQDAGNVTTLSSYLEILKQANLLCGLQKFACDEARKRQSIPKFSVFNNALLTAYRGKGFDKDYVDPMIWGRWVESAVGTCLLDFVEDNDCHLYYWRDHNNEVDYILESHGDVVAIEVKSGKRGMNSGIPMFQKKIHPLKSIVVGTDGIPFEEFFCMDIMQLFG